MDVRLSLVLVNLNSRGFTLLGANTGLPGTKTFDS